MPLAGENELSALTKDPQAMIRVPIGAISPLWGLFAGAAVSGAAWWWMTRWARPANLEAAFGAVETTAAKVEANVEALAAPVVEAVEALPAAVEAAAEPALDALQAASAAAQTAADPVLDAVAEAPAALEPVIDAAADAAETVIEAAPAAPVADALIEAAPLAVGGESAPISPVLEALSADVVETGAAAEQTVASVLEAAPAPKPEPRPKKAAPKAD